MRLSDKGLLFIAREEGVVLDAYKDVKGVWTIGVGHTAYAGDPKPHAGMSITFDEAMDIFKRDVRKYETRVNKFLGNKTVPQHVFDAMVSFDYNTGGIFRASWAKAARDGDMEKAKRLIMNWRKPPQIIPRRERERALLFGVYGDLTRIPVYRATKSGKVLWNSVKHVNPEHIVGAEVETSVVDRGEAKPDSTASRPTWAAYLIGAIAAAMAGLWDYIKEFWAWLFG